MATHFIKALGVPLLRMSKAQIHHDAGTMDVDDGELDKFNEEFDVDTCMEVELSADDVNAIQALTTTDFNAGNVNSIQALMTALMTTDFDAGDVVGKLMAFLSQLRAYGEDVRDFLKQISISMNCPSWDIKLWIRTRWGSLSDCFVVVLAQQKVCSFLRYCCLLSINY